MTKEEFEFVVKMVERHGNLLTAANAAMANAEKSMRGGVETIDRLASERDEAQCDVERLNEKVKWLNEKVERLNDALTEKERTIIARDAAVAAMAGECERLTDDLAEANARPAGLVWNRAANADGTPNLPGSDVVHIATIGIHVGYMSAWSRFDGEPSWVGPDGAGWAPCIEWWAEVNLPDGLDDGGAA